VCRLNPGHAYTVYDTQSRSLLCLVVKHAMATYQPLFFLLMYTQQIEPWVLSSNIQHLPRVLSSPTFLASFAASTPNHSVLEPLLAEQYNCFKLPCMHAEEDIPWEPARDPSLGPRPVAAVPSLFSLSVQLLVKHITAVSSLWGVPDSIRSQLAAAVCAQRKLSPDVALLFGQDTPTELVIPDCSQLDAKAMPGLLKLLLLGSAEDADADASAGAGTAAATAAGESGQALAAAAAAAGSAAPGAARLERLELGACGRGFDDKAAAVVATAGPLSGLRVLRLGGAYRLTDTGLLQLLEATSGLKELAVPSAPRLTGEGHCGAPSAFVASRLHAQSAFVAFMLQGPSAFVAFMLQAQAAFVAFLVEAPSAFVACLLQAPSAFVACLLELC